MMPDTVQPDARRPEIKVADHQISRIVVGQWEFKILWHFINQADKPLYVLIAQPLVAIIKDPLILDHSSHDEPIPMDPNKLPDFEIVRVDPFGKLERRMTYHFAIPNSIKTIHIVGRFGYSYVVPDPEWERTMNWLQVRKWQKIADSNKSVIRFEG